MYSTSDIKNLAEFSRQIADEALKKEPVEEENFELLMGFVRQLEAIRFNPRLFQDILESYEANFSLMEEPLDRVALHINDAGILSKTLVQWRCTNNI